MTLLITTPPAAEPVTLDQAKAHLRVGIDAEDDLIAALLLAARQRVEAELGLALLATGFRESFDAAPGVIALSRAPLIAVAAVAVAGTDGTYVTVPPAAYLARLGGRVAEVAPYHRVWPVPIPPIEGVRVDYTAGYGPGPDDVPGALKQAILALVAYAFDHRGEAADPAPIALVEPWLAPYRRVRL